MSRHGKFYDVMTVAMWTIIAVVNSALVVTGCVFWWQVIVDWLEG